MTLGRCPWNIFCSRGTPPMLSMNCLWATNRTTQIDRLWATNRTTQIDHTSNSRAFVW